MLSSWRNRYISLSLLGLPYLQWLDYGLYGIALQVSCPKKYAGMTGIGGVRSYYKYLFDIVILYEHFFNLK